MFADPLVELVPGGFLVGEVDPPLVQKIQGYVFQPEEALRCGSPAPRPFSDRHQQRYRPGHLEGRC